MNIIEDQVGSPLAAGHGSHPYLRPKTLTLTWKRDRGSSPEWRRTAGGPSATNGIPHVCGVFFIFVFFKKKITEIYFWF